MQLHNHPPRAVLKMRIVVNYLIRNPLRQQNLFRSTRHEAVRQCIRLSLRIILIEPHFAG